MAFIWTGNINKLETPLRICRGGNGKIRITISSKLSAQIIAKYGEHPYYRIGYDAQGHKFAMRFQSTKARDWRKMGCLNKCHRMTVLIAPDQLNATADELSGAYPDFGWNADDQMYLADMRKRQPLIDKRGDDLDAD